MIRHYYTLVKVCAEMQALRGAMLVEAFTQDGAAVLWFAASGTEEEFFVEYSPDTDYGALFLKRNFARARRNTMDVFPALVGQRVTDVVLNPDDRIVTIGFERGSLHALLFSGGSGNLIATGKSTTVIDAFLNARKLEGTPLEIPEPTTMPIEAFPREYSLFTAFVKSDALLGKWYAEEFFFKNGLDFKKPVGDFSDEELEDFQNAAWAFRREILKSEKFYLLKDGANVILSLIPLSKYPEIIGEFDSVSDAIRRRIILSKQNARFDGAFKSFKTDLERKRKKLQSSVNGMLKDADAEKRADTYRHWAELLMSQPNPQRKSGEKIEVQDWEGGMMEIPLDAKFTLLENAKRYYEKARKSKEGARVRSERLPKYQAELREAEQKLEFLKEITTIEELESLKKGTMDEKAKSVQGEKTTTKFREFVLDDGYMLYVGKNAANNDELTMRFAKPNDLWLHARGSAGSHAVLKLPDGKKPPKRVLEQAASVAAYYSQARNAKYTPVAYTFKKHVRKPKGANTGAVVMEKEDIVMVEPKLPAGSKEE
ncbi:MAG: NFACT RNA binding domain-containing protein [Bacteroidota bacterium]